MAIVLTSNTSNSSSQMAELWEDREVRFDIPSVQNKLRAGENVIDRLDFIEDTKGNAGDKGRLIVTNLRIIWHSLSVSRISLSIGFNCVLNASTKLVSSKLRGTTEALYLLTKSSNSRFEFIFTNLVAGNTRHFTSVMGVHKAYVSSRMYRELKLRGAVVRNKQLRILPLEQIYETVPGVWNLSSDQGNLGTFIITNVRLVWFAEMNENFNISLPYIQIASVKLRESRFGRAVVVESRTRSGGYVLGFRVDPASKLSSLAASLSSLAALHSARPLLGVSYSLTQEAESAEEAAVEAEEPEEVEEEEGGGAGGGAYWEWGGVGGVNGGGGSPPVFWPELGLAVEPPPRPHTLASLLSLKL